jgi:hypothetical protein
LAGRPLSLPSAKSLGKLLRDAIKMSIQIARANCRSPRGRRLGTIGMQLIAVLGTSFSIINDLESNPFWRRGKAMACPAFSGEAFCTVCVSHSAL